MNRSILRYFANQFTIIAMINSKIYFPSRPCVPMEKTTAFDATLGGILIKRKIHSHI